MSQKDTVLEILKRVSPLPIQKRRNITTDREGNNRGVVLGLIRNFGASREQQRIKGKTNIDIARRTNKPKYKQLYEEASKLMIQDNPNFVFTSIQINENQQTAKHKDSNNVGQSYIIALGNFTGGEIRVYDEVGDKFQDIDIKNKWCTFDGSLFWHETLPFVGERYSLVFYNIY